MNIPLPPALVAEIDSRIIALRAEENHLWDVYQAEDRKLAELSKPRDLARKRWLDYRSEIAKLETLISVTSSGDMTNPQV